jgi:hypothetical protein
MSGVFGTLTGRGLSALDSTRLRIILIAIATLIVLAVLGVTIASAIHPHMTAPLASGSAWGFQ